MVQYNKKYKKLEAEQLTVNGTDITDAIAEIATLDGLTSTATELNILDGATVTVSEINLLDNQPASITFIVGAEAANVINLSGTIKDAAGTAMSNVTALPFYLADDDAGATPSSTAPDGGIAIGTDGALIESVANLSGMLIGKADGTFDIDITESATPTFYLVVVMPNGSLQISGAITFA